MISVGPRRHSTWLVLQTFGLRSFGILDVIAEVRSDSIALPVGIVYCAFDQSDVEFFSSVGQLEEGMFR